ncbi:hypothetical protein KL905_002171 [Ogataea polymorpha]|uniref:tRNA-dihydrouridine(16/17) synthase [NAD(P)(+)] n=1 Tax=Ogataea polymorpha TaxID=460523 RepID=A0A1B7SCL1_9ASCO|nr:uncharacterized protein OGAPODRAFT_17115 [Ogataea polymorpha]KAG7880963.1 hypothetical protein KL937_001810 [Ogataea polymorpha]KAG7893701.1 hypothetical protein KL908_002755 [Ogataea polymorpha]KAG7901324.1 hypothetical protein KL935_002390 [Ogataea polymorpha]KAG7909578.1 hypothetical protein KL906_002334 [Ogataea polymorpha]KAG7917100.1 hypothetical protein KL927_002874 [Ogataea polymorpha]
MTSSKLTGRQLYDKLGRPKKVVAPMVDGSELAWRMISRKYGADLCYSPMLHSRLFATDDKYREKMFGPMDGSEADRPLIVQFCANDPDFLLQAAKHVEDRCDAVDLNLGCPQGIARKGHYGSFLMEDWDLISKLINTLHRNLKIPVTAKIRVYDDWDKSLAYAKMCLDAGAQFLTVHGRTREMKGQKTGFANWKLVKYIKDNLPPETVFLSNGNILYPDDIDRCIKEVGCDAVMSAEGNLYNPGIFWTETEDIEKQFPRIDRFVREYFDVVARCEGSESRRCFKSHLFKSLRNFLSIHTDVRAEIAKLSRNSPLEEFEAVVKMIEDVVAKIYQQDNIAELDQVRVGEVETWGGRYREVPYWRLQPYFRRVDGKDGREVIQDSMKRVMESEEAVKRQKLEGVK